MVEEGLRGDLEVDADHGPVLDIGGYHKNL
jgi:hypothetical protein